MSSHTNAIKINIDKILAIVIGLVIVIYIIIMMMKEFDFSSIRKSIREISGQLSMTEIYTYLDNHSDYYYKIDDSVYCITKDELIESKEISDKFINGMTGNTIEAEYKDNMFNLKYNDYCIER